MSQMNPDGLMVLRGKIEVNAGPSGSKVQLIYDEGLPNIAFRIKEFRVAPENQDGIVNPRCSSVLATQRQLIGGNTSWSFDDPNQIAFSSFGTEDNFEIESPWEWVDPLNIIVRDLWIHLWISTPADLPINYYVVLERMELDDVEALVALANDVNYIS